MFRRIEGARKAVIEVFVDGVPFHGQQGDTVAAMLLAAGKQAFRKSVVTGEPRGPYCMMGVCFECLVEIDGMPNRQGCLIPIEAGMRIRTGSRETGVDQ